MDKFKYIGEGAALKRAQNWYKNFLCILAENNAYLISDYYGSKEEVIIHYKEADIKTSPQVFINHYLPSTKSFEEICEDNGDKFIKYVNCNDSQLAALIKVPNGEITMTKNSYMKFIKSRSTFFTFLSENNAILKSPYLGFNIPSVIYYKDKHFNMDFPSFKRAVKSTISFEEKCLKNGDLFIKYKDINDGASIALIKNNTNDILEMSSRAYDLFISGRNSFFKALNKVNAILLGSYLGTHIKTTIKYKGAIIDTTPHNFISQTIVNTNMLQKACEKNGDKFIKYTYKKDGVMLFLLETFDGGFVELSSNNYGQFIKARSDFFNIIKRNGHICTSPYLGSNEDIEIDFCCGHAPSTKKPINYKIYDTYGCISCYYDNISKDTRINKLNDKNILTNTFPHLLNEWSDKNIEPPSNYSYASKEKVFWKCTNGHKDFLQSITARTLQEQGCPKCSQSKGEKIICSYLDSIALDYSVQLTLENNKKYDIFVGAYNLIIEVHGLQHYEEVDYFSNRSLIEEKENDLNKEIYAKKKGYNYIIVDYREHKPSLALSRFKAQFSSSIDNYTK